MNTLFYRALFSLVFIGIVGKFLSLGRDIYIASMYGLDASLDVYFYASTILLLVAALIIQCIGTTVIPGLKRAQIRGGNDAKNLLLVNVFNCVAAISLISIGFLYFIVEFDYILKLLAPGFTSEQLNHFKMMIQMGLPSIFFVSMAAVNRSYLQSEGRFAETAFSDLCLASVCIVFLFFMGKNGGVEILIYAIVTASVMQILIQRFGFRKLSFQYKWYINLSDKDLRIISATALPILLSTGVSDLSQMVDHALGSTLGPGGISALSFAGKINASILGVFAMSIATVAFPSFSEAAGLGNSHEMKTYLQKALKFVILLTLPATGLLMVLSGEIVELLFERGRFDGSATKVTSEALFFYSLGMVGSGIRLIIVRVFYAFQDTKTPVIYMFITCFFNVFFNFILIGSLEHKGLALATSLSNSIPVIFMLLTLKKRLGTFYSQTFINDISKICFSSIAMVCFVSIVRFGLSFISIDTGFELLILVLAGFFSFIISIHAVKLYHIGSAVNHCLSKIKSLNS